MKFWLFKSDIDDYPLEKFIKDKKTAWEGVRNYQARNFMMSDMQIGDRGVFYHSNAEPSCAVAILEVISAPKADQLQFQAKSEYFDATSKKDSPRWQCVDVKYLQRFSSPVSLEDMRADEDLKNMRLLQKGNRLSILPLTEHEFKRICKMGGV